MFAEQSLLQNAKLGVRAAQAFLIFIAGCLALAILTEHGQTGSQIGFYFALCFQSIAGLLYQTLVPLFPRVRRFSNVYAHAVLDLLFTILWLAAFASVAAWQAKGVQQEGKSGSSAGCSNFAYGSATKCRTAKASVGFGVIVFLLFIAMSVFSVFGAVKYWRTGGLSNDHPETPAMAEQSTAEDANQDAWDASTNELDEHHHQAFGPVDGLNYRPVQSYADDDQQYLIQNASGQPHSQIYNTHGMPNIYAEQGVHSGRRPSYQSSTNVDFAPPPAYQAHYERPAQGAPAPTNPTVFMVPSQREPSDNYRRSPGGGAWFPEGNYGGGYGSR